MNEDEKKKKWLKEHGKGDVFELTFEELGELCEYLDRSCPLVEYVKKLDREE